MNSWSNIEKRCYGTTGVDIGNCIFPVSFYSITEQAMLTFPFPDGDYVSFHKLWKLR